MTDEKKYSILLLKVAMQGLKEDGALQPSVFGHKEGITHAYKLGFKDEEEKIEQLFTARTLMKKLEVKIISIVAGIYLLRNSPETVGGLSVKPSEHPQHEDAITVWTFSEEREYFIHVPYRVTDKLHFGKCIQVELSGEHRFDSKGTFTILDLWRTAEQTGLFEKGE